MNLGRRSTGWPERVSLKELAHLSNFCVSIFTVHFCFVHDLSNAKSTKISWVTSYNNNKYLHHGTEAFTSDEVRRRSFAMRMTRIPFMKN